MNGSYIITNIFGSYLNIHEGWTQIPAEARKFSRWDDAAEAAAEARGYGIACFVEKLY